MFSIVWTWSSLEKAIDRSLFHSTKKVWQIWRNRKLSRLCWLGRATWVIQRTPKSSFKVEQTCTLNFCMRMLSSIFVRQGRVEFHPSTSTGQLLQLRLRAKIKCVWLLYLSRWLWYNTHNGGCLTVQLISNLNCLGSVALLHTNNNAFSCLVESNPVEPRDSLFSAASPCKVFSC